MQYLIDKLNSFKYSAYVVGGFVRDSLLGLTLKDWDLYIGLHLHKSKKNVLLHSNLLIQEYGYTYGRHTDDVRYADSITYDLFIRDFIMNAIAYNPKTVFINPYHGRDDSHYNMLYCVNDLGTNDQWRPFVICYVR